MMQQREFSGPAWFLECLCTSKGTLTCMYMQLFWRNVHLAISFEAKLPQNKAFYVCPKWQKKKSPFKVNGSATEWQDVICK